MSENLEKARARFTRPVRPPKAEPDPTMRAASGSFPQVGEVWLTCNGSSLRVESIINECVLCSYYGITKGRVLRPDDLTYTTTVARFTKGRTIILEIPV